MKSFARITVNPNQMGGVPCIRDLQISVATLVNMLSERKTEAEILQAYPDLEHQDILEALGYAAEAVPKGVSVDNKDLLLGTRYLLEEYKNVISTHDNVRNLLPQLFYYFLLLSAFPFTVTGIVFKDKPLDLLSAPIWVYLLFIFAGFGNLLLSLALLDVRFEQYAYDKTFNLIRCYFVTHAPEIDKFLYLPRTSDIPRWENLGFVGSEIVFMSCVGVLFVWFGGMGLLRGPKLLSYVGRWSWASALLMPLAYLGIFYVVRSRILKRYMSDHV